MINVHHMYNKGTIFLSHGVNPTHYGAHPENVRFTTPIQQLYNNPSHEGGSHILGPTLM
jgi:hypothetical protein